MQKVWLLLIPVILIAACVQLPFGRQQVGPGPGAASNENPDISVNVAAYPTELKGGRDVSVTWNITNKQEAATLKDINIDVYDQCLFSGDNITHFDELKPDRPQMWTWKWSSQPTQFERDCEIKFKANWTGTASILQDINVLSDTEYYNREQAGTLGALAGITMATSNPVTISLRFSDTLPWIDNITVYMHIDVADTGDGFIDKLPKGSVNITYPSDLEGECDDYETVPCDKIASQSLCGQAGCGILNRRYCSGPEKTCPTLFKESCERNSNLGCSWVEEWKCTGSNSHLLSLARDLTFVNRAAPSLTCTFETTTDKAVSAGTMSLTANYKYELDNSFTVKVKTK